MLRPMSARCHPPLRPLLLRVAHAAEAESPRAILAGRHQQQLAVLIEPIRLREVPYRSLRLIKTAATQNSAARMLVDVFVGPLPDVADQIHHSKRARSGWMRVDAVG